MLISQLGITVLSPIILSTYIGYLLDKGLKTSFFILIFLVLGVLSGGWSAYRLVCAMMLREAAEDEKEREKEKVRNRKGASVRRRPPSLKPKTKSRIFKEKDIE